MLQPSENPSSKVAEALVLASEINNAASALDVNDLEPKNVPAAIASPEKVCASGLDLLTAATQLRGFLKKMRKQKRALRTMIFKLASRSPDAASYRAPLTIKDLPVREIIELLKLFQRQHKVEGAEQLMAAQEKAIKFVERTLPANKYFTGPDEFVQVFLPIFADFIREIKHHP